MNIVNTIILFTYIIFYSIHRYHSFFSIISAILILGGIYTFIFYRSKVINQKKNIIISLLIAIICTVFGFYLTMYSYQKKSIKIQNMSDTPIVIEGVYFNGHKQKLNHTYEKKFDLIHNASLKSEYQRYNKTDSQYKMTLQPKESYTIKLSKVKKLEIDIQKNKTALNVLIDQKKYRIPSYQYSQLQKANMIYDSSYRYIKQNVSYSFPLWFNLIYILFSIYLFFSLSLRSLTNSKKRLLLLLSIIIEFNPMISLAWLSKWITIIFTLFFTRQGRMECKFREKVFMILLSFIFSFSFLGDRIINTTFQPLLIILFIILIVFCYQLIPYLYHYFDEIKQKKYHTISGINIRKHKMIISFLILLILGIYAYIFYPYILHVDGSMEIDDISGNILSNWHPYFHTLLMKIVKDVFGKIHYFIYLRFLLYTFLIVKILFYFYNRGLGIKKIYLISLLLTLSPALGVFMVTLVKDIDFVLFLIMLSFYLFILIYDYDYFRKNKFHYFSLFISLSLVGLFRHNGIYVFVSTLLVLIIYNFKRKNILLLLTTILSIGFVFTVKVPLYRYLDVEPSPPNFDVMPLIHGISYVITQDEEVDPDLYHYLTQNVLTKNELIRCYDQYNIDLLLHYNDKNIRYYNIDKKEVIQGYIKQFLITPISLIKDRLFGTDLIWNNSECDRKMVYKYQIKYDEFGTNYSKKSIPKARYKRLFSNSINQILIFISHNEILNLLFFRGGLYLDFIIFLFGYAIMKKKKGSLFLFPFFINLVTLFIAVAHQEYRYICFMPFISFIYYLLIRYEK